MASASTHTIPSDWSSLSVINPEFASLVAKTFPPNFQVITPETTIEQLRGAYSGAKDTPWPDVEERDLKVVMRDGYENRIRVYTSKALVVKGPLFVMIHGGGFCTGNLEIEAPICREFARDHAGVAVSFSYRLAPENSWPIPVLDTWDAVQWIASNATELGADARKSFILGGTPAGSTCAMSIAHLAGDSKMEPPLTGVYISVPSPVMNQAALPEKYANDQRIVSWEQNKDAPLFGRGAFEFMHKMNKTATPDDQLRSPLRWESGHEALPKHFLQVAGADLLRDYGLIYEEALREAGVETRIDIYPGLIHGFWSCFPEADFTKEWTTNTAKGMVWLLEGQGK